MDVIRLHKCQRCGKTWFPRKPGTPKICPTCKTIHWDTPKKRNTSPYTSKKETKVHEKA